MSIHKLFPSGAIECCAIVSGHLVTKVYYGYTMREARALFMALIRSKA